MVLSPFETALLSEKYLRTQKPKIARYLVVVLALFFTTLHSPKTLTAQPNLDPESLLAVLNQDRLKYGLEPLEADSTLQTAAMAKAQDILNRSYFAHISPDGTEPWDFIKDAGFKYSFAGENLAINYESPLELQNDFMDSPHHRENLLSPLFSEVGIAVARGEFRGQRATITVQMFASPVETLAAR